MNYQADASAYLVAVVVTLCVVLLLAAPSMGGKDGDGK